MAVNPNTKKSTTIQVKSRFQTDCDRSFPVNRLGADFFAFVFLNMGNWYSDKPYEDIHEPEFYIVPKAVVERTINSTKKMPKFLIKRNDLNFQKFRGAWHLIAQNLGIDIETFVRGDIIQ